MIEDKNQNIHSNNTKFPSNNSCTSNNRRLIKRPFDLHNTIQQKTITPIRTSLNIKDEIFNSEPTNAPKNDSAYRKNCSHSTIKSVSLSETKESKNFCADKTGKTSKLNSVGANFKYSHVATKLASVSEVDESPSTQSNYSHQKNSSPLIYVDTND